MGRRSLAWLIFLVLLAGAASLTLLSCGGGGGGGESSGKPRDEVMIRPPGEDRAPVIERRLEDITLTLQAGRTVQWESEAIHTYFSDPDNDRLEYRATSYNGSVARVNFTAPGLTLVIRALALGTARVTLTATDPGGLSVTQSFTVTVNDGTALPPDHADTLAGAADLVSGDTVEGYLDSPNDVDIFRMRIADTRLIDVTLTSEASGIEIALLDSNGNVLDTAVTASDARLRATAQGGDFFVRVRALGSDLKEELKQRAKSFRLAAKLENVVLQSLINIVPAIYDKELEIGGLGVSIHLGEHFKFPDGLPGRAYKFSVSFRGVTVALQRDLLKISAAHEATPGPIRFSVTASARGVSIAVKEFQFDVVDLPNPPPRSVCPSIVQTTVNPGETATFPLDDCFKDDKPEELRFAATRVVESRGADWRARIYGRTLQVLDSHKLGSRDFVTVEVTATDSSGGSAVQAFRVNLNRALHPVETQVLAKNLDPGGSETIDLRSYFRDPESPFGLTFALGQIPQDLMVRLAGSSLTISAGLQAGGGYDVPLTVTTVDGRSKVFDFRVNVRASLRALKDLVVRVMAGRTTTVRLADFIGFPQGVTNPPRLTFNVQTGTHTSRLGATMDAARANLTINPPSGLQGEFSLRVTAIVVDTRFKATEFTFRVIVGDVAGPRLIEGGPPLLVSVEQGGEVMIRLTDHIEDSGGGRLTFAPVSLPPGFGVARNGPDWTIRAPLGAKLGEHVITLTATNGSGMSADFVLRVVVEEAGADPSGVGEPPSDVAACLATLETSLQEQYDTLARIGATTVAVCKTAYCPRDPVRCNCCSTVDDYVRANPARDVSVEGFLFECTVDNPGVPPLTLSGIVGSTIGEHFSIATRADQNMCRTTIDNRRTQCRRVLDDELLPQIERFAPTFESCRRTFNAQVQDCESHFDGQRLKCGG